MGTILSIRSTALPIAAISLMLGGCTKEQPDVLQPVTELNLDFPAIPFTVHADEVSGQFVMQLGFDAQAVGQLLAANQYSLAQVRDFRFTKAQLHLTGPANGNYDAFQSAALQIAIDEAPPTTVASMDPVPNGSHTLLMHLADVNVADLVRHSNVYLIAKVHLDGPLPATSQHSLALSAKLTVGL